ncbi:hypothetical protein [Phenylobacterium sp.]|uniref:hypothetical protein n=1 Tax=Phenylobacterium sp. TaxID=1871053 RepID=UPI00392600D0
MNVVDVWAAVAAAVAAAALALRGNMLKPDIGSWAAAPRMVRIGLSLLSIALGMAAVTLIGGGHATAREAMIYTVLAAVAVVMAWNLHKNGRASIGALRVHIDADEVRGLVEKAAADLRRQLGSAPE